MKRIISTILSIFMLLNCMVIPALAEDQQWWETIDETNKANLSFVYLGNGTKPLTEAQDFPATPPVAGDTIWIGVQFSKMSNLRNLFKSSSSTADSGLNNVTMGVLYDSSILTPITTTAKNMYKFLPSTSIPYDNDNDEALYTYSTIQRAGDSGLDSDAETNNINADNVKSYTETFGVDVESTLYATGDEGASAPRIFQDNVEPFKTSQVADDAVVYGFFGFTVNADAAITPGQTYLQAGLGQNIFSLGLGNKGEGTGMALAWNQDAGTDTSTNLKNYFNLTDKDGKPTSPTIDFWPPSYTVDFYNDSTLASPVGTQLSVKKNETVSSTKVPADTDFTVPEGKYFDKLKYFVDTTEDGTGTANPSTDLEFVPDTGEENPAKTPTQITGNTKVYADYVEGHTVTFNSNYPAEVTDPAAKTKAVTVSPKVGSTIPEASKPTVGKATDTPAPDFATPAGYSFVGWFDTDAATGGNEITFGDSGTVVVSDGSTLDNVYARWAQSVTYTFDYNYTGAPTAATVTKTAGEKLGTDAPADPTRTTYDFKGWNTKSNGSGTMYDATNPIADLAATADTTLYAIWAPKSNQDTYTLTFDAVGGTLNNPTSITVVQGDPITQAMMPDDPTKTGATGNAYTFKGWFKDASPSNTDELTRPITLTENTTAYAHWSYEAADKITITFNDQGATTAVNPSTIDIAPGDAIGALPTEPKKTGSSFGGWYPNADGSGTKIETTTTFSTSTTVYAKWAADINYTFEYNYADAPAAQKVSQTADTALGDKAPANPTRTNYDFVEWNTASNGSGTAYADQNALKALNEASDLTLYAIWTAASTLPPDQKATITFHSSVDGVTVTPSSITVKKGDKLIAAQLPTPERPNYELEGWYDKADVTGTKVTDSDGAITVAKDMDAYAHWTYTGDSPVTVTFNAPDSDGATHTWTVTVGSGDKVGSAAPAVTRTGYTFKEWVDSTTKAKYDPAADAVTGNKTVEATWTSNITVNFETNGGSAIAEADQKQTGKPTDKMKAAPAPTRTDYKLIGWNTEKNGSGEYVSITADTTTFSDVKAAAKTESDTITLYAQWADATIKPNDPVTPPDGPDEGGVLVKFDTNASGSADKTGIIDAKPNWKAPKYGDAIGADQMPSDPVRPNYKLKAKKWNTKPDGSGLDVDGTTPIGANLGDAITMTAANKYEVTLYAQWEVADDVDPQNKITVKFNDNKDGKGKDDDVKTVTVFRGDSLGYVPALPTNTANIKASGWFEGTKNATSGMIEFGQSAAAFTAATPINPADNATEITYYSKYDMYLLVEIQEVESVYDGTEKDPKYKVWQIEKPAEGAQTYTKLSDTPVFGGNDGLPFSDASSQFTVNYTTETVTSGATVKDADTYTINSVSFKDGAELVAQGAKIAAISPKQYKVKAKPLAVTLDPDKQKVKKETPISLIDTDDLVLAENALVAGDTKDGVLKITYKSWEDTNNDEKMQSTELTDTTPSDVAKYVMEVGTNNKNYTISSVESSVDGKTVVIYSSDKYPDAYKEDGTIKTPGTNLVFEVVPNDPSIKTVTVNTVDGKGTVSTAPLSLKQSDYTTDQTFDNAETPTVTEYYSRVSAPTKEEEEAGTAPKDIQLTIEATNSDTTKVTAVDGDGNTLTVTQDPTTKKWTVTAPINKKGKTPNVIKVTTKAGDADDAPSITYTFNVQQLVRPEIKLNPGNSPYGMIANMAEEFLPESEKASAWDKDKITAAKKAFDESDTVHGNLTYGDGYVPKNGLTNVQYTQIAWRSYDKNYDKDETAIFVYEKTQFVDPGLTVYDEFGEKVEDLTFDRNLIVQKMSVGEPNYSGTTTDLDLSVTNGNNSTVFSTIGNIIRPDKYVMNYTYKYTDVQGVEQTVNLSRPVIVLSKRGDIQLTTDPSFNTNDGKAFATSYNKWGGLTANSLFAFRVCDVQFTSDATVNTNDYKQLVSDLGKYSTFPYNQFYVELPTSK